MNNSCSCCNNKVCSCCNSFIRNYTEIKGGKRQHCCDHNEHFEKCEHGDCTCKCHLIQDDFNRMKKALVVEIKTAKEKLEKADDEKNQFYEEIATYVLNSLQVVEGSYSHDHDGKFVEEK